MELLTTTEVAKILRVHRTTVQRLIEAKQLHAFAISTNGRRKQWRITRESLQRMIDGPELNEPVRPAKLPQLVERPFSRLKKYS